MYDQLTHGLIHICVLMHLVQYIDTYLNTCILLYTFTAGNMLLQRSIKMSISQQF